MTGKNYILMIPGIDDTCKRFERMRAYLLEKGLQNITIMEIVPADGSIPIEAMAEQVKNRVMQLQQENEVTSLDLVTYSMGGLIARYFLQRLGGRQQVRRFVTLAGPHHGTPSAYIRWNVGCNQMRPNSPFLRNINEDQNPWENIQVHSFMTPLDLLVFPWLTSILPQAHNRVFWVAAHPLMSSDKRVMQAVYQALSAI